MNARKLGGDSLWVLIARLGAQSALAAFTLLIARRMGETGFGEYAFIAAAVMVGNMLTTYGTDMLLIREIAASRSYRFLPVALLFQLLLAALISLVLWVAPGLPSQSQAAWAGLRVYSLALFPLAIFSVATSALRGEQRLDRYALLNLSTALIQLLLAYWFIQAGSSVIQLAWLLLAVQVAAAVLAAWLCWRYLPKMQFAPRQMLSEMVSLLKSSTPLAVYGLLSTLYLRLGILLLGMWLAPAAVGWFAAAQRVVEFIKTGHLAVFTALYPALAKALGRVRQFRRLLIVLLAAATLEALLVFLFAHPVIGVLFGKAYVAAVPTLRILGWVLIPFTLNMFLTLAFLAQKQEKPILYSLVTSLLGMLGLAMWGLPHTGMGVAAAWLAAEIGQSMLLLWAWERRQRVGAADQHALEGAVYEFSKLP